VYEPPTALEIDDAFAAVPEILIPQVPEAPLPVNDGE
jgi:hypothetical protein